MSYQSYYPVNPARRMAYLLDMPRQPCESCGLVLVVSVLRIDSLHAMSAQVTWGTWFYLVTGILLFCVLLGSGSTWDGPDLELIMGDPNSLTQQSQSSACVVLTLGRRRRERRHPQKWRRVSAAENL